MDSINIWHTMAKVILLNLFIGAVSPRSARESQALSRILYQTDKHGGEYCSRRPGYSKCCTGRDDQCSMPISTTKCYCDQFCNQHGPNRDCCPDYEPVCLGGTNPTFCDFENKRYTIGHILKEQGRECTCRIVPGGAHMSCRPKKEPTEGKCLYNDRYYAVGERVRTDSCTECFCAKCETGYEMQCVQTCPPSPSTTRMPYVCVFEYKQYPVGYILKEECRECTCTTVPGGTHMSCRSYPHCKEKLEVCLFEYKQYPVGYILKEECRECTCTTVPGGTQMSCQSYPHCKDKIVECHFNGGYYKIGQRVKTEPCTECFCAECDTGVEMQCVNTCEKEADGRCLHKNQYYTEGQRIRDGYLECTCERITTHPYTRMACIEVVGDGDIVKIINGGSYGWHAYKYSFLTGKTLDEVYRQRTGVCLPATLVLNATSSVTARQSLFALRDDFDTRTKWPGWIQGIHDQMDYPNSWAFSTAEVVSDRMAVQTNGEDHHAFSAWNLVECVSHTTHCKSSSKAWEHVHRFGVTTEQCYPHSSSMSTCEVSLGLKTYTTRCPNSVRHGYLFRMPPQYKVSAKELNIRLEIQGNGPVQAHLRVKPDFFYYQSGVYRHATSGTGQQYTASDRYLAVRIIGWGVDRSQGTSTKYWLCTNSWGSQWGENGYFRILRGENEAEVETHVVGVWPKDGPSY